DGDIHLALEDATGNNVGTVSAEIPVGPKWCEIRQVVFDWTTQKFPFAVKTAHALKIHEPHVITVTGKAFYDIGHAPADHSNRRSTPKGYAVWEIHPAMKMEVIPRNTGKSSLTSSALAFSKIYLDAVGQSPTKSALCSRSSWSSFKI